MPQPKTQPKNNAPAESQSEAPVLPVDQWHGVGGEYVIENGVRRRVGGPELPAPPADGVAAD